MKTPTEARKRFQISGVFVLLALLISTASLVAQATITSIPGLGGSYYEARALNRTGMVAGFSYTADNSDQHAFLFHDGTVYDLGGFFSLAAGINASGQVAGDSVTTDTFENHAFLFA